MAATYTQWGQHACNDCSLFQEICTIYELNLCIIIYLHSEEKLPDKHVPSLNGFVAAGLQGLDGNLCGDDGAAVGHAARVPLGQVVKNAARHNDVAASLWLHSQLAMQAVEATLQLAYCPVQRTWIEGDVNHLQVLNDTSQCAWRKTSIMTAAH